MELTPEDVTCILSRLKGRIELDGYAAFLPSGEEVMALHLAICILWDKHREASGD